MIAGVAADSTRSCFALVERSAFDNLLFGPAKVVAQKSSVDREPLMDGWTVVEGLSLEFDVGMEPEVSGVTPAAVETVLDCSAY